MAMVMANNKPIFMAGNFNRQTRQDSNEFHDVHRGNDFHSRNVKGKTLKFYATNDLQHKLKKTCQPPNRLSIWWAHKPDWNYILNGKKNIPMLMNAKSFPDEKCIKIRKIKETNWTGNERNENLKILWGLKTFKLKHLVRIISRQIHNSKDARVVERGDRELYQVAKREVRRQIHLAKNEGERKRFTNVLWHEIFLSAKQYIRENQHVWDKCVWKDISTLALGDIEKKKAWRYCPERSVCG